MTERIPGGLEGVVAFSTDIAEPDRSGSELRYRGVDVVELVFPLAENGILFLAIPIQINSSFATLMKVTLVHLWIVVLLKAIPTQFLKV